MDSHPRPKKCTHPLMQPADGSVCSIPDSRRQYAVDHMEGDGVLWFFDGDVYRGEFHEDEMHGQGSFRCVDGSVYVGDFQHDLREGHGTLWKSSGSVYSGSFAGGEMCGAFTRWYAGNGEAAVLHMECTDEPEGSGAKWNATRDKAWRLEDGEVEDEIALQHAAEIAEGLGLSAPPTTKKPTKPTEQLQPPAGVGAGAAGKVTQATDRPRLKPKQRRVKKESRPPRRAPDVRRRMMDANVARKAEASGKPFSL